MQPKELGASAELLLPRNAIGELGSGLFRCRDDADLLLEMRLRPRETE